jgi:hypothetical protein
VALAVSTQIITGVSTGEDDLTVTATGALYQLTITIVVHRSSPSADPGEANPQALAQGMLNGRVATSTRSESRTLTYGFTGTRIPAGSALVAARFDFTSARQNRDGVHAYGKDTYVVRYATRQGQPFTTLSGSF